MYLSDIESQDLAGLKKLGKKLKKAVKKVAKVALPVAGAVGGGILGAKVGKKISKIIAPKKKAVNVADAANVEAVTLEPIKATVAPVSAVAPTAAAVKFDRRGSRLRRAGEAATKFAASITEPVPPMASSVQPSVYPSSYDQQPVEELEPVEVTAKPSYLIPLAIAGGLGILALSQRKRR